MSAPAPLPRLLEPGEAVPWFAAQALGGRPDHRFDTVAGRYILLFLTASAAEESAAAALGAVLAKRDLFDDVRACFFGVTADPEDAAQGRIAQMLPGIRWFLDYDRRVAGLCGADAGDEYRPHAILVDPMLRVVGRYPLAQVERALADLQVLTAAPPPAPWAPVLAVPHVLEPELCRELIALYEASGGEPSGFMRNVAGKTNAGHRSEPQAPPRPRHRGRGPAAPPRRPHYAAAVADGPARLSVRGEPDGAVPDRLLGCDERRPFKPAPR